MDYFVPSILLVVVSWVSFWLDPNAVPGRTTLGKRLTWFSVCTRAALNGSPSDMDGICMAMKGTIFWDIRSCNPLRAN
jgi:hypothetical protein